MKEDELKKRILEIETKYRLEKMKVYRTFAFTNSPYKKGDILEGNTEIIRVESIKYHIMFHEGISECVYLGERLTKKLKPYKKSKGGRIYQSAVKRKLGIFCKKM